MLTTRGHKTVGALWFESICSHINFFLGGYEYAPKTQPFYTARPLAVSIKIMPQP